MAFLTTITTDCEVLDEGRWNWRLEIRHARDICRDGECHDNVMKRVGTLTLIANGREGDKILGDAICQPCAKEVIAAHKSRGGPAFGACADCGQSWRPGGCAGHGCQWPVSGHDRKVKLGFLCACAAIECPHESAIAV